MIMCYVYAIGKLQQECPDDDDDDDDVNSSGGSDYIFKINEVSYQKTSCTCCNSQYFTGQFQSADNTKDY